MLKNVMALGAGGALSALLLLTGTATATAAAPTAAAPAPLPASSSGGGGHTDPNAAVVNLENGPYGQVLVVGGAGAGYKPATAKKPAHYLFPAGTSLYFATVDPSTYGSFWQQPYQPGCGITVVDTGQGPLSCTGSETDRQADWPAFTTDSYPVAGPGVNRWLLGAVYRPDLGAFQVTYAGHPLYLFDPGPNSFFGANFYETVAPLPPWHTAWFLLSPQGTPATGPAALLTESPKKGTTYDTTELATTMLPGVVPGGVAVSVYAFSGDTQWWSRCDGACAQDFIPVTTVGQPTTAAGVDSSAVGVIRRWDGSEQVTYDGHPLYIYSQEQPLVGKKGPKTTGTAGNGNGVSAFGGTFTLVSP
jgi:predicted lipoprotein with Yx(FWY)xxD motif